MRKVDGFTLIEMLVVISIVSMLASVVITSTSAVREKARIAALLVFSNSIYNRLGPNIQGYWNYDNGTMNDVYNVNNPNETYSASVVPNGVIGGSLYDGYGYVGIPDSQSLTNKSGAVTVEAWMNDPNGNELIIDRDPNRSPNYTWVLGLIPSGSILYARWQIYNGVGNYCYFFAPVTATPYIPGKWNHLTGSYDGVNKIRLWVNAQEITSYVNGSCSGKLIEMPGAGGLRIGSGASEGYIDNVRIYDEAIP